jgi:hypothetical protein
MPLLARHGGGLGSGDYINCYFNDAIAKIVEGEVASECKPEEKPQYKKKKKEFRVHVFNDQVVCVLEKRKKHIEQYKLQTFEVDRDGLIDKVTNDRILNAKEKRDIVEFIKKNRMRKLF